jgi:hypothetical protein
MSLSKWQKLSERMTENVVPMACMAAGDDQAAAGCVPPNSTRRPASLAAAQRRVSRLEQVACATEVLPRPREEDVTSD